MNYLRCRILNKAVKDGELAAAKYQFDRDVFLYAVKHRDVLNYV